MTSTSSNAKIEMKTFPIQLQPGGQIIVPPEVQEKLNVTEGDMLMLLQVGDVVLLTTQQSVVPQLANQVITMMENERISLMDTIKNGLVVLIPYTCGRDFYKLPDWYDEEDKDCNFTDEYPLAARHEDELAYLPIYVETTDNNIAFMAAYQACLEYIEHLPLAKIRKEWKERGYSGTPTKPKVKLPATHVPYRIYMFKQCTCCASMKDWKIITPEKMIESLKKEDTHYILPCDTFYGFYHEQLNTWSEKLFKLTIA